MKPLIGQKIIKLFKMYLVQMLLNKLINYLKLDNCLLQLPSIYQKLQ